MTPSVKAGAADVISRLTAQEKACPNQVFALVGYSQGAAVMNVTAKSIPDSIEKKIKALVMFGDPTLKPEASRYTKFSPALLKKIYENCEACDMVSNRAFSHVLLRFQHMTNALVSQVCDKGTDFGPHLHYQRPEFQEKSVDFIVQAFKGMSLVAKDAVPAIKDIKCEKSSAPETVTIPCPKVTAAPKPPARV
jgi:hypothetical protein